ncbi:hypothetical protein F441_03392 [Phytophthora nicotianae CJ01A1]|uniref:Uncharacterized protein n=1 Tax=Phytophthora nicotianae CJ01A1 TaxID=1317063 RepID=W2XM51_PHYNI|nr:hypothetical protein F441_03392 [Phytophthora nicotianae CJ01A1]
MGKVTPVALASKPLCSVHRNADQRVRTEQANAERLSAPNCELFEDYQATDGGTCSDKEVPEGDERARVGPSPSVLFAEDDERLVGEIVPHPGMQLVFQTTVRWVLPLVMLLQTLPPFFVVPTEPWTWLRYCPSPSTRLTQGPAEEMDTHNLESPGWKTRDFLV